VQDLSWTFRHGIGDPTSRTRIGGIVLVRLIERTQMTASSHAADGAALPEAGTASLGHDHLRG
jgi:hypothetical protein